VAAKVVPPIPQLRPSMRAAAPSPLRRHAASSPALLTALALDESGFGKNGSFSEITKTAVSSEDEEDATSCRYRISAIRP